MDFRFWRNKKSEQRHHVQHEPVEYVSPSMMGMALPFNGYTGKVSAMNISAAYRCAELISDSIAMLPIEVSKPSLRQLFQGNDLMSKYTFIKLLIQSVLLKGNGFAYIERSDDGKPFNLVYLDPSQVTINYNREKRELYYIANSITSNRIYPNDMLHFVKNSYDGINGLSVLSFARTSLTIAAATEKSASKFFEGGCNLSGILTVNSILNQEKRNQIRGSWQQAYTDGGSGLAILEGNMSYSPVQLSNKDAQMLESRQYNVQDICRFFGVSPVLVGDLTKASFSTLEAVQSEFLVHTLQPYIVMLEEEFNRKLGNGKNVVNFDENSMLRSDKSAQATYYTQLVNTGIMSINEVRQELGYEPVDGLDEHHIAYNSTEQSIVGNTSQVGQTDQLITENNE